MGGLDPNLSFNQAGHLPDASGLTFVSRCRFCFWLSLRFVVGVVGWVDSDLCCFTPFSGASSMLAGSTLPFPPTYHGEVCRGGRRRWLAAIVDELAARVGVGHSVARDDVLHLGGFVGFVLRNLSLAGWFPNMFSTAMLVLTAVPVGRGWSSGSPYSMR